MECPIRLARFVPVALVLAAAAGCSSRNTYFDQRGRDLADILRLNFSGMGPGFIANVRATQLVKVGAGYDGHQRGEGVGLGTWRVGTLGRHAGVWQSDTVEGGLGPFYYEDYSQNPVHGNVPPAGGAEMFDDHYRSVDEIGATVHLGIFGMDVAVRPLEILDFLLGVFTLDPLDDDLSYQDPGNVPPDLEDWEKEKP